VYGSAWLLALGPPAVVTVTSTAGEPAARRDDLVAVLL